MPFSLHYEPIILPSLFNPSNDMALAADSCPYTPPPLVRRMEADLASLSRFWSSGPWGWSRDARWRYLRMGVSASSLPSPEWLRNARQLSSRAFACGYLSSLLRELHDGHFVGDEMRYLSALPSSLTASQQPQAPLVFKSPWSSSGRGVIFSPDGYTPEVLPRLRGFLRTQGGYLQDRLYTDKICDFAMEFVVRHGGEVEFLGYSFFLTGPRGNYRGNLIAPQSAIIQRIGVDEALLNSLILYHRQHLGSLGYQGPVGIDMMLLSGGRVHPVVEINFRHTMGSLALALWRQGITADCELTPVLAHGFQAVVRGGILSISYKS